MSNCTLATGCPGCTVHIEHNLIWLLRNKPARIKDDTWALMNLEHARNGHGSAELRALVKEYDNGHLS
jgi:hypothetical protein